jgi:membrane protease YdiL (CAAX protease family)
MQAGITKRGRALSFVELALGSFIVIGHNLLHILPNEVPILCGIGWISLQLRDGGWQAAGLRRPASWWKTIALAFAAAAILQLGSEFVISPLANRIWPEPQKISRLLQSQAGDWKHALISLLVVWTFAAFGEELSYRGYLLTRAADVGGRSDIAYLAAMICIAVLFGFGHYYKGPAGIIDSTYSGIVLGCVYLFSGRNLWSAILAHGISDTVAVAAIFAGWAD